VRTADEEPLAVLHRVQDEESEEAPATTELDLGHEYSEHNRERGSRGGGGGSSGASAGRKALLYLPNRLADLVDIVRLDVGVGFGYGAVARITKHLQMGYRHFDPGSMRFGLRGRRAPVFLERADEKGFGGGFKTSPERKVTAGEFGLGADLAIIGAYAGICFDELADFAAGLVTYDFKGDDFR
jgi:hypothetical protein